MDDHHERLIEAAVRPLADDAEMERSASRMLEEMIRPDDTGGEAAIARWALLDGKNRWPVWRISLFLLLGFVSMVILIEGRNQVRALKATYNTFSIIGAPTSTSGPTPPRHGAEKKDLTEDERLILFGDESQTSKADRAKGLWDRHPENPAYFAQYAETCLSTNRKLPADFLTQARKIDPRNAWFIYLAAAIEAKDCVKKKPQSAANKEANKAPEWEVADAARLETALGLFHEARDLQFCNDYKAELMRQRIPLLSQDDKVKWLAALAYFGEMTSSDLIYMRNLGDAVAARAETYGRDHKVDEFRELMADSDAFMRKVLSVESNTVVAGLIYKVNILTIARRFAATAGILNLHPDAERFQAISDELKQKRKGGGLVIDGEEFVRKSGFLAGMTVPMVSRQVKNPPVVTDEDLKPGRLMEHEIVSSFGAAAVFFLTAISLLLVWASGFARAPMIRRLAKRIESLMRPCDWMWIIGLGVIAPLVFVMAINRLTPLGGRGYGIYALKFILPIADFSALLHIILILPIMVTRWRLGKRAGALGFDWSRSWIGWLAVGSCAGYVIGIGLAAPYASMPLNTAVTLFFLPPELWLLIALIRSIFAKPARLLISATVARVLVPVYAFAMLMMISLVPVFSRMEQYWFKRDTFMKLDPKFPSFTPYEYKVAAQLQEELRKTLGYEPNILKH